MSQLRKKNVIEKLIFIFYLDSKMHEDNNLNKKNGILSILYLIQ